MLWLGNRGVPLEKGTETDCVREWVLKHPILPAYLRLARTFNVTLADLLTGKVSMAGLQALNFEGVPRWHNLWARRHTRFNRAKAARQMDEALREVPAPSLNTLEKRTGYHKSTLLKHFPDQCTAVKQRFRAFSAASIQELQAKKIAEFRQLAYQLHEQGTELFVNTVRKRMSVPKSLDCSIARVVLAEVKREILAGPTRNQVTEQGAETRR